MSASSTATTPSRMQWQQLLSAQRFKVKAGVIIPGDAVAKSDIDAGLRTAFHIDHDRLVFSTAFRRLARKTQVHPLAVNDHIHNRLTHSLEVASVGRSLGNRVGLMLQEQGVLPAGYHASDIGAIVQVACLAHDIGNPPFGHTGEDALRTWFCDPAHARYLEPLSDGERLDVQTYEGNAHGLRMVATLEMYYGEGGMRLTAASMGALVKYPWTAKMEPVLSGKKPKGKFNIYTAERDYYAMVAAELGLLKLGEDRWARHPLSYLMEAADDICYAILDLEDAVEIGILAVEEFEAVVHPVLEPEKLRSPQGPDRRNADVIRRYCAAMRGMVIGKCVEEFAATFMRHHNSILEGGLPAPSKDLLDLVSAEISSLLKGAKELASERVYRHRSKVVKEVAAYPCLKLLLDALIPDAYVFCTQGPKALNTRQKTQLALLERPLVEGESPYSAYMKILDYIGGMTDNYAATLASEISGVSIT
ncbi:MAG: deoxyguanosinetriphosphate triphosphohydrolase [Moraxellaceae bacterium]